MELNEIVASLAGSILGFVVFICVEVISVKRKSKWEAVSAYWNRKTDTIYSVEKRGSEIRCYINGRRVVNDLVLSKGAYERY